jgi:hypothetical protein
MHRYGTQPITERQISRMERLPPGTVVVSTRAGIAIVRRPDGQVLRIKPDGHLLANGLRVERVQSYLHVSRC